MAENNVPLSLVTDTLGIGTARYHLNDVSPGAYDFYWLVVVDRKTLKVVANAVTENQGVVPAEVKKYDGNNAYILVATSFQMTCKNRPTGELDTFLKANGADIKYKALQQIAGLGGPQQDARQFNYLLVSIMGQQSGIEAHSIGPDLLALPLELILEGDQYIPVDTYPLAG